MTSASGFNVKNARIFRIPVFRLHTFLTGWFP